MVLRFYGYDNITQAIVGKDLNVKLKRGCYPRDIIAYLKRFNIVAEKSKKISDIAKIREGYPIFLGQREHFMLLIGVEGEQFVYIDPATGRKNKDKFDYFKKEIVDLVVITSIGVHNGSQDKKLKR